MRKAGFVVSVVLVLFSSSLAHAQVPRAIFYDTFMQQNLEDRLRTFTLLSPGERSDIVRVHISRWMYVNRTWLTQEQWNVLEEFLYSGREHYVLPPDPDATAEAKEMMTRAATLFSRAEIRQALTVYGNYIPQQPGERHVSR